MRSILHPLTTVQNTTKAIRSMDRTSKVFKVQSILADPQGYSTKH